MPLITGNRAVEKAYIGATGLNAIMHAGVNLLDGTVLPSTGRTLLSKLTSSLILHEGTGNPAFSMSTAYWTDKNDLGLLRQYQASSAFFGGARLVRNVVATNSEDFSGWSDCAGFTRPSANVLLSSASTTAHAISQNGVSPAVSISRTYFFRYQVQYVDIRYVQLSCNATGFGSTKFCNFDLVSGTYVATNVSAGMTLIGPGLWDVWVKATATTTTAAFGFGCALAAINSITDTRFQAFVGDGVKSLNPIRADFVDVTGYDAAYLPEYISVGVLSSPYHGAGTTSAADGAKYYNTDWQGAPIAAANLKGFLNMPAATNLVLHSRDMRESVWTKSKSGIELVVDGQFDSGTSWTKGSGWTISGGVASKTAGVASNLVQSLPIVQGTMYAITLSYTTSAGAMFLRFGSTATNYGSFAGSGTQTFTLFPNGDSNIYIFGDASFVGSVDNISVQAVTVQPTKTATGIDGIANSATRLTFGEANATIKQSVTVASADRCTSAYIKLGTPFVGPLSMSQDDGANWTDVTSQLNSSTFARPEITLVLANPVIAFKSGTAGDVVDVDVVGNEAGKIATPPIVTTTATVSRGASSLTYQTASNFADAAGTMYIEAEPQSWSLVTGGAAGSATNGLLLSSANSGATAYDGTNAANGPTGTPSGREKLTMRWTGSVLDVASSGALGTPGIYDGAMGLSSIAVGAGVNVPTHFKNLAIYSSVWTDDETKANVT